MANGDLEQKEKEIKQGIFQRAKAWGDNPLPPAILATLMFPQHYRPFQPLPMLFPPVLMFTSYLNLSGFQRDAAGMSAAWSGIYLLLASRRRQKLLNKFGPRGILRGVTMGLCLVQVGAGGVSYAFGDRGRSDNWIGKGKD